MGREFELKYRATPEQLTRIAQAYPALTAYEMASTYYDTPSGALSALKYTLRLRLENGRRVCTLKTPGQGHDRGEWEAEAESIESAIPMLCKLGAPEQLPLLCAEGLIAICGAEFLRRACSLELPGGQLELALDQGFLTGGGRCMPLCEVEVELKAGSDTLAEQFAKDLAETFQLTPESASKFRRALALAKGE